MYPPKNKVYTVTSSVVRVNIVILLIALCMVSQYVIDTYSYNFNGIIIYNIIYR